MNGWQQDGFHALPSPTFDTLTAAQIRQALETALTHYQNRKFVGGAAFKTLIDALVEKIAR